MIRWAGWAVAIYLLGAGVWILRSGVIRNDRELLHVACDPTRELWADVNRAFLADYEARTQERWAITMSHGGSGSQARAIQDGLEADFASLALWTDTDILRRTGLLEPGWEDQLPRRSLPYVSTIVFVVRKGNPKGIRDWPDLVRGDTTLIVPNPKTSGNGKWAVLAAWGAGLEAGWSESACHAYMTEWFRRILVLDASARNATATFATKKLGDVHLTWENEAILEVEQSQGDLELVYPPRSIIAEPHVAILKPNARKHGRDQLARAYAEYLYTAEAQHRFAKHHHRPTDPTVAAQYHDKFPEIAWFPATRIRPDWPTLWQAFFADHAWVDSWLRGVVPE